ncbi:hypothetical protein VULLAG_LOCUS11749 [Vulpes lagopus]
MSGTTSIGRSGKGKLVSRLLYHGEENNKQMNVNGAENIPVDPEPEIGPPNRTERIAQSPWLVESHILI